MSKFNLKNDVPQITDFSGMSIKSLLFSYPPKEGKSTFNLVWNDKVDFLPGNIVQVCGDSGHGKSTFFDIISGSIQGSEYSGEFYVDTDKRISGFDCLIDSRFYNEQDGNISQKASIAQIVSGNLDHISEHDEDIIWQSLVTCSCIDFVSRENSNGKKKWIHEKSVDMSGGQKGRIKLARTVFSIIIKKPKFVMLDEVDKAVQSEEMVRIMTNIYDFTKQNNIIVFIIAHSTEVKDMKDYDTIIKFVDGTMNISK